MGIAERLQRWLWIKPIPPQRHSFSSCDDDKEVLLPFRKKWRWSQGIKFTKARITKSAAVQQEDHIGIKEFIRKSCEKVRLRVPNAPSSQKGRMSLFKREETRFYGLQYYSTTRVLPQQHQSHYDCQGYHFHHHHHRGKRSAFHMTKHAKEKF